MAKEDWQAAQTLDQLADLILAAPPITNTPTTAEKLALDHAPTPLSALNPVASVADVPAISAAEVAAITGSSSPGAGNVFATISAVSAVIGALTTPIYTSGTITSATPLTERLTDSELTLTPASSLAVSGSLAAVRGCVTLTSGKSVTGGFLYGTQGKVVLDGGTIAVGSAHVAGIYGQMSANGATISNGHVAVIIASGQNLPNSPNVDMFYAESGNGTGGAQGLNSILKAIVDANYLFDISADTQNPVGFYSTSGTAGVTASKGWLKINLGSLTRYIPLTDSVT